MRLQRRWQGRERRMGQADAHLFRPARFRRALEAHLPTWAGTGAQVAGVSSRPVDAVATRPVRARLARRVTNRCHSASWISWRRVGRWREGFPRGPSSPGSSFEHGFATEVQRCCSPDSVMSNVSGRCSVRRKTASRYIPPERLIRPNITGRGEVGGGRFVPFKDRPSGIEIVAVSVVERHGYGLPGKAARVQRRPPAPTRGQS